MIATLIACGIATAVLFLWKFYFPIMQEIKEEENLRTKDVIEYNWFYRGTYIAASIVFNIVLFPLMMTVMFFRHDYFKQLLKTSTRERILDAI